MELPKNTYTIGEAAKLFGVSITTLRRWDKKGIISTGRTPSGYRVFAKEEIDALKRGVMASAPSAAGSNPLPSKLVLKNSIKPYSLYSTLSNSVQKILAYRYFPFFVLVVIVFISSSLPQVLSNKISNNQAVLGVESFIAPLVESPIGKMLGSIGTFLESRASLFLVALLDNNELGGTVISSDLTVDGNVILGSSELNSLVINPETVTFKLGDKTLDITGDPSAGSGQVRTLTILNSTEGQTADLNLSDGDLKVNGVVRIANNGSAFFTNFNADDLTSDSISSSNLTINNNITIGGLVNSNTLNSTSLIFSGTSPSIYPSTANSSISLNGGTGGAVNIANVSTGDISIGGGKDSTGCTITNSNGDLNCSGNISSSLDLVANGGDITTNQTTFNLLNSTVTTLNIGGAGTAISIGASTGTTTINNALTVTGASTLSSTLSVSGASTFTGAATFNSTATFNSNVSVTTGGQLSLSRVPTLAHTGTWAIGSASWNESNATIYVNPASATADSNIFALSVGGSVKFDVDAEGDVYANNVILSGSVTSATTTVGTLNVEGNTTLGDATTDTLTINPATLTLAGGNKTIDLTGVAARTLTILNSTASQVADLDLSDGDLKLGGTVRISNAGTGTFSGLTLSTGALSLTGTSGSIALTGFGTTSITSTTTSGDILAFTDTSLNTASANLSNFTFKNNNTGAGLSVSGVTITEQAAGTPSSGTNTSNLLNLSAAAGGTVNGINISSATGFTNFIKTPTFNLDSSGNVTGVPTLTATNLGGTLSTAAQTSVTSLGTLTSLGVTGNINSVTGALQTNSITRIDNSGNLTAGTGSFAGAVSPSLDATYDLGTAVLRWKDAYFSGDVVVGDAVFKNDFRLTEHGNTGIDMLNPKGEVIASWDENGNFWVKGEITHGSRN